MDTTLQPVGTVPDRWKFALSLASSRTGNHALGLAMNAVAPPDVVGSHPAPGVPSYSTRTRNSAPRPIGVAGTMMRSFAPVRAKDVTAFESTVTERIVSSLRCSVKLSSVSVAVAVTTVTPRSVRMSGW
ncbi:hypothetical protein [Kibdelosporangium aridum]|uniref:hypothetical protein n=1 Tax=Kibdelosporangium aridum TaxID=2030 RepID=UPI0035E5C2A1